MLNKFAEFGGPLGIRAALLSGDERLTADNLEQLMQLAPSPDEAKALKLYRGTLADLSPPEQFLYIINQVPRLPAKIGALLFRRQFKQLYADAVGGLEALRRTCQQLRSSRRIRRVLATLLAAGNALNAGTHRGNAEALKLDSLLKVADVKVTAPAPGATQRGAKSGRMSTRSGSETGSAPQTPRTPVSAQKSHLAAENNGVGGSQSVDLPPVRTLLEFVAWKVFCDVVAEGEVPLGQLADVARAGYLTSDVSSLGDAVRRMQSGELLALAALQCCNWGHVVLRIPCL